MNNKKILEFIVGDNTRGFIHINGNGVKVTIGDQVLYECDQLIFNSLQEILDLIYEYQKLSEAKENERIDRIMAEMAEKDELNKLVGAYVADREEVRLRNKIFNEECTMFGHEPKYCEKPYALRKVEASCKRMRKKLCELPSGDYDLKDYGLSIQQHEYGKVPAVFEDKEKFRRYRRYKEIMLNS